MTQIQIKVARLAVTKYDYIDNSQFSVASEVLQTGSKRDRPTQLQVEDFKDSFKSSALLSVDDPLMVPPLVGDGIGDPSVLTGITGSGSGQSGKAGSGPGLSRTTGKKGGPPKIKNAQVT